MQNSQLIPQLNSEKSSLYLQLQDNVYIISSEKEEREKKEEED